VVKKRKKKKVVKEQASQAAQAVPETAAPPAPVPVDTGPLPRWAMAAVVACVLFFLAHAAYCARVNSVTPDEYVHVPAGLSVLQTGSARMDHAGSPPLVRAFEALPLLLQKPDVDYESRTFEKDMKYAFGWDFMRRNMARYHALFFWPRMMAALLGALCALLVFAAARSLYGNTAGLAALALFCFLPEAAAHASLATVDMGAALLVFAAFWMYLRYLDNPGAAHAAAAGAVAGMALLAKYSAALVLPAMLLATVLYQVQGEHRKRGVMASRVWSGFALACAAALFVVNAGFGFDGSFQPLASQAVQSPLLKSMAQGVMGRIPFPLPALYVNALDAQMFKKELYFNYYLMGHLSKQGFPQYFLMALALKTPLPLLGFVLGAFVLSFRKTTRFTEIALWLPPLLFVTVFSLYIKVDLGVRYMLPIMPFLVVLASGAFVRLWQWRRELAGALAAMSCASLLFVFGNPLAYFNTLSGGDANKHLFLVESNLDWGQNLVRLKNYMDKNDIETVRLASYTLAAPQAYGIKSEWAPCEPDKGVIAISVNYLHGVDPFLNRPRDCFDWLRNRKPDAILGHGGMFVYDTRKDSD
jgi:hypothetical protein